MFTDFCLHPVKRLPFGKFRQLLFFRGIFIRIFRCFERTLKGIFKILPAVARDALSRNRENMSAAGKLCLYRFIQVFLPCRT